MFGSNQEFGFESIPMQFWYFVISGGILFVLILAISIIVILFKEAVETKTKFLLVLKNGSKAFIFIFLIPIFFFLANFAIANLSKLVTASFGSDRSGSLADYLYNIGNGN
jgi:hypothetical protein